MRHAGARARRGVEAADVVADAVGPHLGELRPVAEPGRPPLAGQDPGGAAGEHEVERLDERARQRPRPLAAGGRCERRAHAASSCVGASSAPTTVSRMRSSTSSARTPSPSAS